MEQITIIKNMIKKSIHWNIITDGCRALKAVNNSRQMVFLVSYLPISNIIHISLKSKVDGHRYMSKHYQLTDMEIMLKEINENVPM